MARRDPYAGFRFVVEIDGLLQGGFAKVRGLNRETKVESFREGGVNDFERKLVDTLGKGGACPHGNLVGMDRPRDRRRL